MTHTAENDAGRYEPCVIDAEGVCTRWSHEHAEMTAVLGEHRICWRTTRLAVCSCGEWARPDEKGGSLKAPVRREHDAHVARALLPLLTRARGEAEAAWDDGWNAAVDSNGFPGDVNPYRPIPPTADRGASDA